MSPRIRPPLRRLWNAVPVRLFIAFLIIYALTAGISLGRHSLAPHFVYLAESLLHGRLDLLHVPGPPYDLTLFAGRWYVSFPPLPALLMLPLVALCGLAVSDVAFSVVLGAINVTLFYAVLSRAKTGDSTFKIWMCVLLGLGTPLWYCATLGSVWYTAHVAAITCLCLYALEVMGQNRPLAAGFWLGLGFLARAPVLFAFPLCLMRGLEQPRDGRKTTRFLFSFGLGMAPALLGQAAYNWARFGSVVEFGYRWMNSPGSLLDRQAAWGQFSLHFLPENLYTLLIRPPLISLAPLHIEPDPWGMGLLFTCPALVLETGFFLKNLVSFPQRQTYGFFRKRRKQSGCSDKNMVSFPQRQTHKPALTIGLSLSIALIQIPSLLYFNTGSYQFGYRFALDWLPLGILLAALISGGRLRGWPKALIIAGVLMHTWGVLWMYPNFNGQPWQLQYIELMRRLFRAP